MTTAYIGIGSNEGDRFTNLHNAIGMLVQECTVGRISSIYETEPEGYADQPDFLNCVVEINTDIGAHQLLQALKGIEMIMGRQPSFLNGPRIIDLDILLYGDSVINSDELTIPHPRMHERAFVLIPFNEIAPGCMHPDLHKTINELLGELNERKEVKKWGKIMAGS